MNRRFTLHHLVLKDKMELLRPTQGDEGGSLATYMQDFNQMLIVLPLKEGYAKKLFFLHGLKPWVWKIIYYRTNISNTCQGLMKMVECMKDKGLHTPPRVKLKTRSPIRIKSTWTMEAKATTNEMGPKEVGASRRQGKVNGQGTINKEGETRPIQGQMFQLWQQWTSGEGLP